MTPSKDTHYFIDKESTFFCIYDSNGELHDDNITYEQAIYNSIRLAETNNEVYYIGVMIGYTKPPSTLAELVLYK